MQFMNPANLEVARLAGAAAVAVVAAAAACRVAGCAQEGKPI